MSVAVRRAGPPDQGDVDALIAAAFGADDPEDGRRVVDLWADVRSSGLVLDELVAVDEGDGVVGHVGVSHAWLDTRATLLDVAVLSPLATTPSHQGRGVGTALLAVAVDAARATGRPMLFLEGSPWFYGARGFERAAGRGVEPATRRTPEPAFQVALLEGHEPWMTGRLVYPDVWWRHDAAGLRDPDLTSLETVLDEHFPPLH